MKKNFKKDLSRLALMGLASGFLLGCQWGQGEKKEPQQPEKKGTAKPANGSQTKTNGMAQPKTNGTAQPKNGQAKTAPAPTRTPAAKEQGEKAPMRLTREEKSFYDELNDKGKASFDKMDHDERGTAISVFKHGCKGQNSCKGLGGCKGEGHDCAGKNECAGKGTCKVTDPNKAVRLVENQMMENQKNQ